MKRILIVIVVIAAATVAGTIAGRLMSTAKHEEAIDPQPGERLSAGKILPLHRFHDLAGDRVEIQELIAGKKAILFFFSTECTPCVEYMSEWDEWLQNPDLDYRFIGISPDDVTKLLAFDEMFEPRFPVLWDRDETFGIEYNIRALPVIIGVEDDGVIAFVEIGYRRDKHLEIDSWLRDR